MSDLLAKKDELDALDATDVGADPAGTAATAVSNHSADTTAVHGISDTSALETTTGAQAKVDTHVNDTADAHDASAISILDTANDFTATEVEGALAELQTADEADEAALAAHISDATAAHAASAVAFTPNGSIAATDVQTAIQEVRDEAAGGGAPSTADYLVGTTDGGLSNEIVVGTSPGGELGGTWASPTVDATHSGSTHAATQAAAEATAASALSGHVTDTADAHDASAISADSTTLVGTGTDVQAVLEELDNAIAADVSALSDHIADTSAAHAASTVSANSATLVGTGTDVQAVLEELDNAIVADETALANHLADTADAHDASAISILDTAGDFDAANVEDALAELQTFDEATTVSLSALNTQAAIAAAKQAAIYAANAGYYIGAGLDYTPSGTAGKLDRTSGVGLFGPVEGTGGTSATAIGSTVATLGAGLSAGEEMWVTFEVGSTGTTFQTAGSAAAAGSAAIPDTTAGRVVVGWLYIEFASVALNAVDELLTTPNDKAKFIDARVVRPGPSVTGWCYDQNLWEFVSSTTGAGGGLITVKVPGVDVTGYITPGTKFSWDDGTNTPGYGVIATSTFSTDTTITLIKQSDYVMDADIKYPRYSRADCPVGFPGFFNWLPTLSGWSSDPTNASYTWYPCGPRSLNLTVRQLTAGTSNSATHNMTLPVAARTLTQGVWSGAGTGVDNGSAIQAGTLVIVSAATTCGLNGLITNTSTASGSSRFGAGQIPYPY